MKTRLLSLLSLPLLAFSQSNARVAGVTNTQAILSYRAETLAGTCTVEVSESATYSPVVNDVNAVLAEAQNVDLSRASTLTSGLDRIVIVGKRTSTEADDGKLYSMALKQNQLHYFRIDCGGTPATGTFRTSIHMPGKSAPEAPPFTSSTAAYGNYAWPTIDLGSRSAEYADPLTGLVYRLMTSQPDQGMVSGVDQSFSFYHDLDSAWSDDANIINGSSAYASTSTADAPIFAGVKAASSMASERRMADMNLWVIGYGDNATEANRTVKVCLTVDSGQTCYSAEKTVVLPQTTPSTQNPTSATFPSANFGSWSRMPQSRHLPKSVTVDASGTAVTRDSYWDDDFPVSWTAGTKVYIVSSGCSNLCTVSSVTNSSSMTLEEDVGTLADKTLSSANFGIRLIKTTSTGTVYVTAKYRQATSGFQEWGNGGADDRCNRNVATDSTGARGHLCKWTEGTTGGGAGAIYWVGEDGTSRVITHTVPHTGTDPDDISGATGTTGYGNIIWSLTEPNVWYSAYTQAGGGTGLFKATYAGDYSETSGVNWAAASHIAGDQITYTNLTYGGYDINTMIQAEVPGYNYARYGAPGLAGGNGARFLYYKNLGNQDTITWYFVFNVGTSPPSLERAWNTFDGSAGKWYRWFGGHSQGAIGIENAFAVITTYMNGGGNWSGPYWSTVSAVKRGVSTWDANDTRIPATYDGTYYGVCPGDIPSEWIAEGATGNNCLHLKIAGELCSTTATATSNSWSPCPHSGGSAYGTYLQDFVVGDILQDYHANPEHEDLRVVKKTTISSTEIEVVVSRVTPVNLGGPSYCGQQTYQREHSDSDPATGAGNWKVSAGREYRIGGGCTAHVVVMMPGQDPKPDSVGNHFDIGSGLASGESISGYEGFARTSGGYANLGDPLNFTVNFTPGFDSAEGLSSSTLQTYFQKRQWPPAAVASERIWALSHRHIQSAGSVTTALESGTSKTFKINILGTVDFKRLGLMAWAGHRILGPKMGPGSTLGDSDLWRYCYAYKDDECRTGSSAGEAFVVVENHAAGTNACPEAGGLLPNFMPSDAAQPCLISGRSVAAKPIQYDVTGNDPQGLNVRDLGFGFTGPGRQPVFFNTKTNATGKWAFTVATGINGTTNQKLGIELPPWRTDGINRTKFVDYPIAIGPGADKAAVHFGYRLSGTNVPWCHDYEDGCLAGTSLSPFAFENADTGYTLTSCSTGCTIVVPAISGRILYYQVKRYNSGGSLLSAGNLQVAAIP